MDPASYQSENEIRQIRQRKHQSEEDIEMAEAGAERVAGLLTQGWDNRGYASTSAQQTESSSATFPNRYSASLSSFSTFQNTRTVVSQAARTISEPDYSATTGSSSQGYVASILDQDAANLIASFPGGSFERLSTLSPVDNPQIGFGPMIDVEGFGNPLRYFHEGFHPQSKISTSPGFASRT